MIEMILMLAGVMALGAVGTFLVVFLISNYYE